MHRDIGYLPEQPYFYDYLTARELLDYYARFSGYGAAERRERVARFLERVGLAGAADVQLRKFSKGMLQRAGIAQAILHDPKVVFLDEPMSGLDPVGRREVRDIIQDLKQQGRTVFFSTHILSDAEMLCDRVAVLVGGKLQGVGAPGDIVSVEVQGMEILFEAARRKRLPAKLSPREPRQSASVTRCRCRRRSFTRCSIILRVRERANSLRCARAPDTGGLFLPPRRPRAGDFACG